MDEDSGYRRYSENQLETARLVALLRRLDMPLAHVAEVVDAPEERRAELVASYWDSVERPASQRELAAHLRIRLSGREGGYEMYEILERDVPEQLGWIRAEGRTMTGSPREVYFADWDTAAHDGRRLRHRLSRGLTSWRCRRARSTSGATTPSGNVYECPRLASSPEEEQRWDRA